MIHYHGLPITPNTACLEAIRGGHAFISYRHPAQLGIAIESAQSFALDNGAFSAWRNGEPVTDWSGYYEWVDQQRRLPGFDFAIIPDVIEGSENDNDHLIYDWPFSTIYGAPVWHLHESLERLGRLCNNFPRVCFGSSGDYAQIGTVAWWRRMGEAMTVACDAEGRPLTKLHGLRMLDPAVFTRIPFASADSTNIGRNVNIDAHWRGTYTPPSKDVRAAVMRARIEAHQSPARWEVPTQQELSGLFDETEERGEE